MKKTVFFLMGIFALAACSEDVYHDIDKQNNGLETGNNPDSEGSGGNAPFTHVPGTPDDYISPWDIRYNTSGGVTGTDPKQVSYRFNNWTGDWDSPHLLTLRVTPYIGLAYYDGTNDGNYYGNTLNFMNYPNLYPIPVALGGSEIGHFIPAVPFDIDGSYIPSYYGTAELVVQSGTDHCPVLPNTGGTFNPVPVHFDVSPTVGNGTPEEDLLKQYGKVFFYFCEVIDPVTTATVWSGYMMPNAPYYSAYWTVIMGVTANIPGVGPAVPLLVNTNSLPSGTPSQEVILNPNSIPVGLYKSDHRPINHNGTLIYLEVKTDATQMSVTLAPII